MTYHDQIDVRAEGHAMEFQEFVTELDARIHEHTGTTEDPIGVMWVSESTVLWSGRNGFVQAEKIGVSMISFAMHLGDEVTAQSRFADEMTGPNVDDMAQRIVRFLNDPVKPAKVARP